MRALLVHKHKQLSITFRSVHFIFKFEGEYMKLHDRTSKPPSPSSPNDMTRDAFSLKGYIKCKSQDTFLTWFNCWNLAKRDNNTNKSKAKPLSLVVILEVVKCYENCIVKEDM